MTLHVALFLRSVQNMAFHVERSTPSETESKKKALLLPSYRNPVDRTHTHISLMMSYSGKQYLPGNLCKIPAGIMGRCRCITT